MRRFLTWTVLVSLLLARPAAACTWDYDTLEMERQQYPEVHELLAGHFVRHSDAYYQWRIGDRTVKSVDQRTPADYNDIGVAYDKLGEHDKAIETMREKLERWPDENLYESHANLGTFLIHNGQYEDGLVHIKKAIEINPDAHFGREIYQQLLVEYVVHQRQEGETLPLHTKESRQEAGSSKASYDGFASFVSARSNNYGDGSAKEEYQRALKGVLGMVRFGQHNSPILMEAAGDLILATDATNTLAARAYLRASYEAEDRDAKATYRQKAENAIASQRINDRVATLGQIEAALQAELAQAEEFSAQIAADEQQWIAAGENVDAKFSEKYYNNPKLDVERSNEVMEVARVDTEYEDDEAARSFSSPVFTLTDDSNYESRAASPSRGFSFDGRLVLIFLVLAIVGGAWAFRRIG